MMKSRIKFIPILFAVFIGFMVRWWVQVGFLFSDDMVQFQTARAIAEHAFNLNWSLHTTYGRYGLPLLAAPFFMLLGISAKTVTLTSIFLSLGEVFLLYLVGASLLESWKKGAAASLCLALFPITVVAGTLFLPDVPMAFLLLLYAYATWLVFKPTEENQLQLDLRKIAGLGAGCGFFMFFKESGVIEAFLLPLLCILWHLLATRITFKRALACSAAFFAGVIAIFSLEALVNWLVVGNPLARYQIREERTENTFSDSVGRYPNFMAKLAKWGVVLAQSNPTILVMAAMGVVLVAFLWNTRKSMSPRVRTALFFILLWELSAFLPFAISLPLTNGIHPRRVLPMLSPMFLLAAACLPEMMKAWKTRIVVLGLAACFLVTGFLEYLPYKVYQHCGSAHEKGFFSYLPVKAHLPVYHRCKYQPLDNDMTDFLGQQGIRETTPIYGDAKSLQAVSVSPMFIRKNCVVSFPELMDTKRHPLQCRLINYLQHPIDDTKAGYIILLPGFIQHAKLPFPQAVLHPPSQWQLVYHRKYAFPRNEVMIYRIPGT